jgi:hypothetical protein
MGLLIKIILFGIVFYYIFKTVGGFVYRILGGRNFAQQQRQNQYNNHRREGEINVDYVPEKDKSKRKGSSSSKSGEYIDYEEVK